MQETPIESIKTVLNDARAAFSAGKSKPISWRRKQLEQLLRMCDEQKQRFGVAAHADFHRPETETFLYDCGIIRAECIHALNNLDEWTQDETRSDTLAYATMDKYVHPEPYGVCLIIGAWNYPFLLTLNPLVGAIAAGNCAILKPSELAPHSAQAMSDMVSRYMDTTCIKVVLGGIDQTQELLKGDIDKIFYTGSTVIGKKIMQAAAERMIPVTLECGGKCPCYVAEDANMAVSGRRIAWGKGINCGQTCVAPDYILCSKKTEARLLPEIIKAWREFYTDDPLSSASYCHLVNERHFERVAKLIDANKTVHGGQTNAEQKYIAPTIMTNVSKSDKVMQEEIFGPVLPFITVQNEQEAIEFINEQPKSLALYIFTSNKRLAKHVIDNTSAGSTCINDVVLQIGPSTLPFGGVGPSGFGSYHGKYSFEAFSHLRSVAFSATWAEAVVAQRNPPYTVAKTKRMEFLTKAYRNYFPLRKTSVWFWAFGILASAVAARVITRRVQEDRWDF